MTIDPRSRMDSATETALAQVKPSVRKAFASVYTLLVDEAGCQVSARPGYVSFSLGEDLVAAAHPRADAIDLALAIPLDPRDDNLFDAIDFKWRSLPAAVTVTTASSARLATARTRTAIERVRSGIALEIPGQAYARPKGSYDPAFKKGMRHRG